MIRYGLPVWGGYISASQKKQINAMLCRFFKCCFSSILWNFDCLLHEVDSQFFKSMQNSQHCMNCLPLTPETLHTVLHEEKKPPI